MDIVVEPSQGLNIVAEPKALPPYQPDPEVDAAFVEVFWQEVDAATGALLGEPNAVGKMPRGAAGSFQYTPVEDKTVRLFALPYNVHGVPADTDLRYTTTHDLDFTPTSIQDIVAQTVTIKDELLFEDDAARLASLDNLGAASSDLLDGGVQT